MNQSATQSTRSISPFVSEKIKVISFLAIIVVFFIHSTFPEEPYETFIIPVFMRKCTSGLFGPCAVPMFYAISGFLYYNNVRNIDVIIIKIKKRFWTLIIPFIIAAVYYPSFFILMEIIPWINDYIDRPSYIEMCKSMMPIEILCSLFYGSSDGYPWAYHLWFMRDLIIIVFLSPIIFFIKSIIGYWTILITLVLYLLFPHFWFLYAMFWFVSGSLVLGELTKLPKWSILTLLILFISMAVFRQFIFDYSWKIYNIIEITAGITSIWCIYDYITNKQSVLPHHEIVGKTCRLTFFLYLYHEPVFHIIVKSIITCFGKNTFGYSMSIILPPIIIIYLGYYIGYFLINKLPRLYKIISGGR